MSQKAKNGGLVPVEVANAIMYFIKAYHLKTQNTYDSKVAMATEGCHVTLKKRCHAQSVQLTV